MIKKTKILQLGILATALSTTFTYAKTNSSDQKKIHKQRSISSSFFTFKKLHIFDLSTQERPLIISDKKTHYDSEVARAQMAPRGSAALTAAGQIPNIKNIIHVATGSMTQSGYKFAPTLEGIQFSIRNSIHLAEYKEFKCIAIPFIGSGIFFDRIGVNSKEGLAFKIYQAIASASTDVKVIPVAYSAEDFNSFTSAYNTAKKQIAQQSKSLFSSQPSKIQPPVQGSLLDYNVHKCSVIVNPANMELTFGGGLSGMIARQTQESQAIDQELNRLIKKYNQFMAEKEAFINGEDGTKLAP